MQPGVIAFIGQSSVCSHSVRRRRIRSCASLRPLTAAGVTGDALPTDQLVADVGAAGSAGSLPTRRWTGSASG